MYKYVIALMLASTLLTAKLSSQMCNIGGVCGWIGNVFGCDQQMEDIEELVEYVVLEGKEIYVEMIKTTINALKKLYAEHPEVFMKFFEYCIKQAGNPLPLDLLAILKEYNLLQSDATISDAIQTIVLWVVDVNPANQKIKIWLFEELLKKGAVQKHKKFVRRKIA